MGRVVSDRRSLTGAGPVWLLTQWWRDATVAAVRCPKCGVLNPDGHRRGARCVACHESLRKCRYCAHYDSDIIDCTNVHRAEHDHIIDADEASDCPEFTSILDSTAPRPQWHMSARTFLITAVLALAAALGAIRAVRGPAEVSAVLPVHASVTAPDTALRDEGFDLTATVFNPTDEPARNVEILISGRNMSCLTCQYVNPPECFSEATPRAVSASFGDVPAGEQRSISFHFVPSRAGEISLVASVTVANTSGSWLRTIRSEIIP